MLDATGFIVASICNSVCREVSHVIDGSVRETPTKLRELSVVYTKAVDHASYINQRPNGYIKRAYAAIEALATYANTLEDLSG